MEEDDDLAASEEDDSNGNTDWEAESWGSRRFFDFLQRSTTTGSEERDDAEGNSCDSGCIGSSSTRFLFTSEERGAGSSCSRLVRESSFCFPKSKSLAVVVVVVVVADDDDDDEGGSFD